MIDQHIGTCIIVTSKDQSKVLLGKRKNAYKSGLFGLPGGRIELGEAAVAAAKRELAEETGLSRRKVRYVGVVKEYQGEWDFIHLVFGYELGESEEPTTLEPDKCEGWQWFGWDELPERIVPGHKAGINLYRNPKNPGLMDLFAPTGWKHEWLIGWKVRWFEPLGLS